MQDKAAGSLKRPTAGNTAPQRGAGKVGHRGRFWPFGAYTGVEIRSFPHSDKILLGVVFTIAADLKLSKSTVGRALADLEKAGLVNRRARWRKKGGRSSNLYWIFDCS